MYMGNMLSKYYLKHISKDYIHPRDEEGNYKPISSKIHREMNGNKEPWDLTHLQFYKNDNGLIPTSPVFESRDAVAKWIFDSKDQSAIMWMRNG